MAVLQWAPIDDAFERAASLGHIARTLLAIRMVCTFLVTAWISFDGSHHALAAALCVASGWMLLMLMRWDSLGQVLCSHPAILALDYLGSFFVLSRVGPLTPALLLVGSGCLLSGLCLDRRGALIFPPLVGAGWWLVYATSPGRAGSADGAAIFTGLVMVPVLLIGVLIAGVAIRDVALKAAENERLMRVKVRAAGVSEERARLAREMHDSLVKSLHGVALLADALPGWIRRSPDSACDQARIISEQINRATKESRELIVSMRRADANASVTAMVRSTVDRWSRATGRGVDLEVAGSPSVGTESSYELDAILAEALENISRHTPADARATVRLGEEDAWVALTVADDGPGAPEGFVRTGHFGVVGMRERAARVGGSLEISGGRAGGVEVRVRVPAAMAHEEDYVLAHEGGSRR